VTEAQWQQQVCDLALILGYQLQYHTRDSRRSAKGFPDLVLVNPINRRVVYVELKTDSGNITNEQALWGAGLSQAGAEWYLWRPSDLETAYKVLKGE
jgi:hypothetical protein